MRIEDRVLNSELYKSGEWFTAGRMASVCGCTEAGMRTVLSRLRSDELLDLLPPDKNSAGRFRRRSTSRYWLSIPWRSSSEPTNG